MRVTSQRTQNQSPGRGRIRSKRGNRKQQDERLEGRKGSESARQNEDERERVGEGDRGVMAIERSISDSSVSLEPCFFWRTIHCLNINARRLIHQSLW